MTDLELAEEIERVAARTSAGDFVGLPIRTCYDIIAALRRRHERPPSSEMLFHVDGKEMKLCDCSAREGKCPRGVERRLLTTEFSRCLLPR